MASREYLDHLYALRSTPSQFTRYVFITQSSGCDYVGFEMTSGEISMTSCDISMTSRDILMTSRDNLMMSHDILMTSRDTLMTSRDNLMMSRDKKNNATYS